MSWQDISFGVGGFFFAVSLIPTIRSRRASVPLWTSVPTALVLTEYVFAEWTAGLHLGALAGVLSASAWWAIAALRRPRKPGTTVKAAPQPNDEYDAWRPEREYMP